MENIDHIALRIRDLTFSYPRQEPRFSGFNLEVNKGERFGLFGPNGAGKTTLIHLMTGLLSYKEGHILVFGHEARHHKKPVNRLFGFVPQDFSFYPELSPVHNLEFFGAWCGLSAPEIRKRTNELLDVLGLLDVRDKAVGKFSGGMKRRVNLAIGVIHKPQLLFLDEPTVGVDVHTRHAIIEYLRELNSQGTTLIYTSHQLSEAEALCDKIALMDEGKIVAHDSLTNLLSAHRADGLEGLFLGLTGKSFRDN